MTAQKFKKREKKKLILICDMKWSCLENLALAFDFDWIAVIKL